MHILDNGAGVLVLRVRTAVDMSLCGLSRELAQMKRLLLKSWLLGPMLKSRPSTRPTRRVSVGGLAQGCWATGSPPAVSISPLL